MNMFCVVAAIAFSMSTAPEVPPAAPAKAVAPAGGEAASKSADSREPAVQMASLRFRGVKDQVMRYRTHEERVVEGLGPGKIETSIEVDYKFRVLSAGEAGWRVEMIYERVKGKNAQGGKAIVFDAGQGAAKVAPSPAQDIAVALVGKVFTLEVSPEGKVTKSTGPEVDVPKDPAFGELGSYASNERIARGTSGFFRAAGDAPAQAKAGERWTYKSPHTTDVLGATLRSSDACRVEKIVGDIAHVRAVTSTKIENPEGGKATVAMDRDREEFVARWDSAKGLLQSGVGDLDGSMTVTGPGGQMRIAMTGRIRVDRIE